MVSMHAGQRGIDRKARRPVGRAAAQASRGLLSAKGLPARSRRSRWTARQGISGVILKPHALAHGRGRMEDLPSLLSSSGAGKANA